MKMTQLLGFWAVFYSSRRTSQIGPTADFLSAAIPALAFLSLIILAFNILRLLGLPVVGYLCVSLHDIVKRFLQTIIEGGNS